MIRNIFIAIAICAIVMQSTALIVTRTKRSSETCGVSKSRMGLIVHGQPFPRGAFPWIVALMFTETRPPTFFCAGTLISKTFVISGKLLYVFQSEDSAFSQFQSCSLHSSETRKGKTFAATGSRNFWCT